MNEEPRTANPLRFGPVDVSLERDSDEPLQYVFGATDANGDEVEVLLSWHDLESLNRRIVQLRSEDEREAVAAEDEFERRQMGAGY